MIRRRDLRRTAKTVDAGHWSCCHESELLEDDDTLVIRLSDTAMTREVSQDWHTHISDAADGSVVETVILEAAKLGAWPLEVQHTAAV